MIAIYDIETGRVLRAVSGPLGEWRVHQDVGDGESFIEVPEDANLAGKRIVDRQIVDAPDDTDMGAALRLALRRIMDLVSRERQSYITDAAGQDLVYGEKAREARAWVSAGRPDDPDAYPNIAGSAEGAGVPFLEEAALVEWSAAQWAAISSDIERRRAAAMQAARAAPDPQQLETAIALYEGETP